jgi:hypothetical protein
MSEKKPKFRSFAKRLTRWIAFTQFIVMVFVSYWIFVLAKNIVLMEEASLHKSSLLSAKASVGRVLTEVYTATGNRVDEIQENLGKDVFTPNFENEFKKYFIKQD